MKKLSVFLEIYCAYFPVNIQIECKKADTNLRDHCHHCFHVFAISSDRIEQKLVYTKH